MKKYVFLFLKIAISAGIIAYLVWTTTKGEGKENALANLKNQQKNWEFLACAWAVAASAAMLTFVRWWYLMRALEIPCRFRDALRVSFWGYLFNFLPLGIVSGDVVKVAMLSHELPKYKSRAATSVFVDRAIGLYLMFVVASAAILLTGYLDFSPPVIRKICWATIGVTVAGALGIGLAMTPMVIDGKLVCRLEGMPRAGRVIKNMLDAVRTYRSKPTVLIFSSLMSVGVHLLFSTAIYLIARGLPGTVPPFNLFFVVVPMSFATQVIPFSLGPLELAMEALYQNVPATVGAIIVGQGFVVALVYRIVTLLIAALGTYYYLGNRREVTAAIHESDAERPGESMRACA
jgi:uncharacterized protein (TIRG00374 family)